MCAENDAQAKEWLDKVKSQGDDYAGRVRAGTLGGSADETQQLLDEVRGRRAATRFDRRWGGCHGHGRAILRHSHGRA
eukprot:2605318-Prymnesium_polylepis.1